MTSRLHKFNIWLTLAANVGVLAGIVFLALEIRQNTAATHSATVQSVTDNSTTGLRMYAANADLSRIRLKGDFEHSTLTELERFQYFAHNRGFWLHFQNVYFQIGLGALEPRVWATYERIICMDMPSRPGLRIDWEQHSPVLDPEFVAVVEGCMDTESASN